MKNPKFDYLLSIFLGNDSLRPGNLNPIPEGEFVYATDGCSVIKIASNLIVNQYSRHEKAPTVSPVYDCFNESNNDTIVSYVSVDFLSKALSIARVAFLKQICEQCKGQGVIVCECCGSENDCKECKGEGNSGDAYPIRITYSNSDCTISIPDIGTFSSHLLERVLISACVLGSKNIFICKPPDSTKTYFKIPSYENYSDCVEIIVIARTESNN